eukprot:4126876-Heterocapsa_arctica.AAC.1
MTGGPDVQQNTPEVVHDGENDIDTQEYGHLVEDDHEGKLQASDPMGGQTELTQDGVQNQEDILTQDYKDHQIMEDEKEDRKANKTNKRGSTDNEDEQYPGISNEKRVKLRAEQLFVEAQ